MNDTPKAKKSVALSGVTAGNTALCSVGQTGNDLHYRGYDILEIATTSEFEEIAFLLIHGKLPNSAELAIYKTRLRALRGLPAAVRTTLRRCPRRRIRWTCCAPASRPWAACCRRRTTTVRRAHARSPIG
jgi:citrate synthase